jgi:hypothetical protein
MKDPRGYFQICEVFIYYDCLAQKPPITQWAANALWKRGHTLFIYLS